MGPTKKLSSVMSKIFVQETNNQHFSILAFTLNECITESIVSWLKTQKRRIHNNYQVIKFKNRIKSNLHKWLDIKINICFADD